MKMADRATYGDIKFWFLCDMFDKCRDKWFEHKLSYESLMEAVYGEFCLKEGDYRPPLEANGLGQFKLPIEYLMLAVVYLVMAGPWSDKSIHYAKEVMDKILDDNDLIEMLESLPEEERYKFEFDLKFLKNVGIEFKELDYKK
jgi:hypothetical protein